MQVQTASTHDGSLLRSIRSTLDESDEALLAVAFVSEAGVHLVRDQLRRLGSRARLLVTTTFGTTSPVALKMAADLGTDVRTLNPGSGTYHPKAFLTRSADGRAAAVVGSSNLTGGLIVNVEVATALRGRLDHEPIAEAWRWAERTWDHPATTRWRKPDDEDLPRHSFHPLLLAALQREVERNPLFATLTRGNPNRVVAVTPAGLYVETRDSLRKGTPPQLVPSWMFELAYEALRARGRLSQQEVLNTLNIKRSAAVCAILARLNDVVARKEGRATVLLWRPDEQDGPAAH